MLYSPNFRMRGVPYFARYFRIVKKFFAIIALLLCVSAATQETPDTKAAKPTRTVIINSANSIEYTSEKCDSDTAVDSKEKTSEEKNPEKKAPTHDTKTEVTDKSENAKHPVKDEKKIETIILTGDVSISVQEGATLDTIFADRIIYNKTRNTLHAEGAVRYERKIAGKISQTFRGKGLLFDIKGMNGVFLDGIVEADSQKKNTPNYVIHSETTGRDASEVTAFKNAKLTTSTAEEPLWSINASRIWLLPGNEMSFANGYFSIGVVPIFYLPFFYHPADEMIFHPAFGYKPRGGYFTQTTTYLIGRKKLPKKDADASFSNFLTSDTLKEQKRHGLFFQNLSTDAKKQEPTHLKLIADMYSSLGFLLGLDGDFASAVKYFNTLNFNTYFAFSYTQYPLATDKNTFTMHDAAGDTKLNKANFFGFTLPFRYHLDFNATISKSPVTLTMNVPFVSDPFFKSDFFSRSEDMNWFKFMLNRNNEKEEKTSEQTSYNWLFKFSANPSTGVLSPYIRSFSISPDVAVNFYSKENRTLTGEERLYAPERKFYYPEKLYPKLSASLSGTIFSTDMLNKKNKNKPTAVIDGVKNPFAQVSASDENTGETETPNDETLQLNLKTKSNKTENEKNNTEYLDLFLPLYKPQENTKATSDKIVRYSLGYDVKGDYLHEGLWDQAKWKEPKDINWKNFYSHYYRVNYEVGLNSELGMFYNFLKVNNSLLFKQNYQRHPYVSDQTKKETLELNNFKANTYTLQNKNSVTLSPFYFSELFKGCNVQWSISEIVLRNKFTGTYTAPKYEIEKIKWNKEFIKEHNFSTVLAVTANTYTQSLKLVAALPPLLNSYTMSATFQYPYGSASADTKIYEKEKAEKKWFWSPFNAHVNWKLPFSVTSSQMYSYNIEDKKSDTFRFTFGWKYLSLNFLMQRDLKYKLDPLLGWQSSGTEKKFIPKSFECNFSNTGEPWKFYFWKNRIGLSLSLSSTLNFNMQKVTESFFSFSPTLNFSIHEFLTLKIGTVSRNDVIARYFQNSLNLGVTIPGETNVMKDLLQSFYFWDKPMRQQSGFKIKSVDIALEHNLKDWTLNLTYSFLPERKINPATHKTEFNFIPKIMFMVTWNPINDIRVKTKTENKKFTVERGTIR